MQYQTIWFRKGKAYLPAIGSPPSGMFFELDPVEVVVPTLDKIEAALTAGLGRPVVRLPERSRFDSGWSRRSVVQDAAGFESWKSFVRRALRVALIEAQDGWHVVVGEGASPDDVEDVTMPAIVTIRELAERTMDIASRRPIWVKE